MDDHLITTIIMIVVLAFGVIIGIGAIYTKHMDNSYNYRIEWADLDQDMATIIDLKEEEE